ncbi:MAG: class F sortase [Candidatus Paceibacterota bacterium]
MYNMPMHSEPTSPSSERVLTVLTAIAVLLAITVGLRFSGSLRSTPPPPTAADTVITTPGYATSSLPVRIQIPKINVDTEIEHVGLTESSTMATPSTYETTAWYEYGAHPGERGNAVIAGHLDNSLGRRAVFYDLSELTIGDTIIVTNEHNDQLVFEVVRTETYPYTKAPIDLIFGTSSDRRLNLTTCAGDWLDDASTYQDRFVVFTKLRE